MGSQLTTRMPKLPPRVSWSHGKTALNLHIWQQNDVEELPYAGKIPLQPPMNFSVSLSPMTRIFFDDKHGEHDESGIF